MTLYHFGNCVALIYVPYFLTYKYAGLSEYGAFWKCFQAGGIYVFTQLCKMLVLATFVDTLGGSLSILNDILKVLVDGADFLGIALILSRIPGKDHNKLITTGFGWAAAEVVLSRALFLWIGARGSEFDWIYIQKCLESNISLIEHITTAALVWMFTRKDINEKIRPVLIFLLLATIGKPMWLDNTLIALNVGPWITLALKALASTLKGFVTLNIYVRIARQIGV